MRVKLFLLMLALLARLAPWALAQRNLDVAGREARVALVIGNAAYTDAPLQGAGTCIFANSARYKVHIGN